MYDSSGRELLSEMKNEVKIQINKFTNGTTELTIIAFLLSNHK